MRNKLVAACTAALMAATTQAAAGTWLRAQSEHFVVTTDAGERRAREYLRDLESLHHVVLLILGVDAATAQAKPRFDIVLLQHREDLGKVRSHFVKNVAGVYLQCREGSVAYVGLPTGEQGRVEDFGLRVLFHEYAHHVMYQYASMFYPSWYVEGFAEYLGNAVMDGDKLVLGDTARGNALWLRTRPWVDFEMVLKPPFRSAADKDADNRFFESFYNQSWLLAHYMLSDSTRTKQFNDYFARVGAGEDPITAFEPAMGMPVAKLSAALRRHFENLPVVAVSAKGMRSGEVQVEALPAEADEVLLDASVLRTCAPKDQGEAILARLRTLDGQGSKSTLRLALARAELLYGSVQAAKDTLQALVAEDEANFEAQYLLGRTLVRESDELGGEPGSAARAQARSHLFKAYRLKKNDAPHLFQLARVLAADGTNPNMLNAAQGARALAPGVAEYATFEALVDLDAGQRDRALRALTPLASNPHDPAFAARVRGAMQAIRAGQTRAEVQRALFAAP